MEITLIINNKEKTFTSIEELNNYLQSTKISQNGNLIK